MGDLRVSFPRPCDQSWEAMAPADRARHCARCDRIVHDLAQYDLDEAEALLRREPGACVRARVGADGEVALKPGRRNGARRMAIAAAATAGLLAAWEPALAKPERPGGVIAGKVPAFGLPVRVTATSPAGQTFRTKVHRKARFRIRGVPAGTYTLTFTPGCGESWTVENVVVGSGETIVPESPDAGGCIVIGLLRIDDAIG